MIKRFHFDRRSTTSKSCWYLQEPIPPWFWWCDKRKSLCKNNQSICYVLRIWTMVISIASSPGSHIFLPNSPRSRSAANNSSSNKKDRHSIINLEVSKLKPRPKGISASKLEFIEFEERTSPNEVYLQSLNFWSLLMLSCRVFLPQFYSIWRGATKTQKTQKKKRRKEKKERKRGVFQFCSSILIFRYQFCLLDAGFCDYSILWYSARINKPWFDETIIYFHFTFW